MIFANLVAFGCLVLAPATPTPRHYGQVLSVSGRVSAKRDGKARTLSVHYPVYQEDQILLTPNSSVRICRAADGRLVNLSYGKDKSSVALKERLPSSIPFRIKAIFGEKGVGDYSQTAKTATKGEDPPRELVCFWPSGNIIEVPTRFRWFGKAKPDARLVIQYNEMTVFEKAVPEGVEGIEVSSQEFAMQPGRQYRWRLEGTVPWRDFFSLGAEQKTVTTRTLDEIGRLLPDFDEMELGMAKVQYLQKNGLYSDSYILLQELEQIKKTPLTALLSNAALKGMKISNKGLIVDLAHNPLIKEWGTGAG